MSRESSKFYMAGCFVFVAVVVGRAQAVPVSNAITYQGRLTDGGQPANGVYDLQFSLWDAAGVGTPPVGGAQVGVTICSDNVTVTGGLFTVSLDFGSQYTGDARWLQIGVRAGGAVGNCAIGVYTVLGPRQPLTATPYALGLRYPFSGTFDGTDQNALSITQTGLGYAASFGANDPGNYYGTLGVSCAGTGPSLFVTHSGNSSCARFQNVVTANSVPTVHATTNGTSAALYGDASVGTNGIGVIGIGRGTGDGVRGIADGSGNAIEASTNGTGRAGYFENTNPSNNLSTLRVDTNSTNPGVAAIAGVNTGAGLAAVFQTTSDSLNVMGNSINSDVSGFLDLMRINDTSGDSVWIGGGGGNVGIGGGVAGLPFTRLHVDGGSDANTTSTTSGYFLIGSATGSDANIVMDNNEIMARAGINTSTLFLNHNGGQVHIGQGPGGSATGRLVTPVVQITGGSDLSENFDVASQGDAAVEPGMVVCIDAANPGKLTASTRAYDRTVAGVISGAGDVKTGMVMGQAGSIADGSHPVALTGRVYVRCDASEHAIQPGDLLTTSDTSGHAMKASDHARAQGAIIGKAMTALEKGEKGLILVLVSLQ